MWLLPCLVVFASLYAHQCKNTSPTKEEFKSMLFDAAAEVLAQHSQNDFEVPPQFMRSFRPGTGVGNREELIIEAISVMEVYSDFEFSRLLYKHFKNSDYIVGITKTKVVLFKFDSSKEFLVLSAEDAVFNYLPEAGEATSFEIKDVELFTRFSNHSEMYVGILVETMKTAAVYVYEIAGNSGVVVASIDLNIVPSSRRTPMRIAYVQSSRGGSLVVLVETDDKGKLSYKQRGRNELNHYILLNYRSVVDLITFTVKGRGYIAVATHTACNVFEMDEYARNHILFNWFNTPSNITDLEYFRMGLNHFLVVAQNNVLNLYTWKNEDLYLEQEIKESDVVKVHASTVESCRDEVILLVAKRTGDIRFYVYSGRKEKFEATNAVAPNGRLMMPRSPTSFSPRNGEVIILYQGMASNLEAFLIKTSLLPLEDTLYAEGEKVTAVMKNIRNMLNQQKEEIESIKKILSNAVRTNGEQRITGVHHFNDISSTVETVVEELGEFVLEWGNSSLTLEEYRKGADDFEKDVEKLEKLVEDIEVSIPDLVLKDEDAIITGRKIFRGNVYSETVRTTTLNLEKVADINLAQVQEDIYRVDKPQQIRGTLLFKEPLTITGNLDVERTVNGIDISEEVMTTHTEQESEAQIIFKNKLIVEGDLDVSGKVNGIDISEEIVTLNGTSYITGLKNFQNGIKAENVDTKLLDGIDIDDLYTRALSISKDQTITEDIAFKDITTNDIILEGTLNGYNIKELNDIVRIDKPATITGYKVFTENIVINGPLSVNGTVNDLRIPDDLFLVDQNQTVTGRKEFMGHVSVANAIVKEKMNGIRIPEDIVTLSDNEEISSTMYFLDGIEAKQNINVEGHVDGIDLSDMAKQALNLNKSNEFEHAVFLGPVNIKGNLIVKGLVNKVSLTDLVDDIVFKDINPVKIMAEKNFLKVKADRIKLNHNINGYNLDVDFMKVHGNQNISGTKVFEQPVTFNSINVGDEMIDGLNISEIYKRKIELSLNSNETDNEIEFAGNVIVNNLKVRNKIGGLKFPEDIVLSNSTRNISNKHFAGKVVVDKLLVDGDMTVDKLEGKNLTRFYHDRITVDTDQVISGDLWIGNSTAKKVLVSGLVNGLNITDFANNVMSKTKPQTVTAAKEFLGDVIVNGDITTDEGVNGFNLSDIKRRAFKLSGNNTVTAPLEFGDNVTFNRINIGGNLNGINVTRLNEDSLKKSGKQLVKGNVVFNAGFHVVGDINAEKVNGLVIKDDILLKNYPQTIKGQFTFGSVGIAGDLSINGSINGLDLSEIAPKLANIEDGTIIKSDITFNKPIYVNGNIEVTGKVNGVDLKETFGNVLWKTGDVTVTGKKIFKGNVTINGDIDVKSINDIKWDEFLNDVVWKNVPQVINSSKTFKNIVSVEKDVQVSGLAHVKLVNGIDLQKFIDEAVYVDVPTNITGPVIFKHSVEIQGDLNADLINGLSLKNDVINLKCKDNGAQTIEGLKTFENIKVFGNVIADKVNSYDLRDLYEDTLLTEGNQTVTGQKIIFGDVTFKSNVWPQSVNGMKLSKDLISLNTEQTIEGPLTFKGDVFVEKNLFINGLLNGVNLSNLSQEAIYLKEDRVIEGFYSIQNAVVAGDVEVNGTVNGIDLVAFQKNVEDFVKETEDSLELLNSYAKEHCELAKSIQESLMSTYYSLDSFVVYQKFNIQASFIEVKSEHDIYLRYLDDMATMATSVQIVWDNITKKFAGVNSSKTDTISNRIYHIGNTNLVINVGINKRDSTVEIQGLPVPIFTGFSDASVVIRELDAFVTLLFSEKSTCDTYLIKDDYNYRHFPELVASVVQEGATSITTFEESMKLYMAVASSSSYSVSRPYSSIYVKKMGEWQKLQTISLYSSSLVKHFVYHGYHYLAFGNNAPMYMTKEPMSIQIYRNTGYDKLFSLFQKVPFDNVGGLEVFQFGDLSQLHLIVWNDKEVKIFGLEGESGMKEYFTFHGQCIKDVKPLISEDFYLVVGQQNLKTDDAVQSIVYKGLTKGFKYEPYRLEYC